MEALEVSVHVGQKSANGTRIELLSLHKLRKQYGKKGPIENIILVRR
jgi:hypothetical protein